MDAGARAARSRETARSGCVTFHPKTSHIFEQPRKTCDVSARNVTHVAMGQKNV